MRKILTTILLSVVCMGMFAVPARRGQFRLIKLADGIEVKAELKGDEHCHYWMAGDGRTFIPSRNGDFYEQVAMADMPYYLPMDFSRNETAYNGEGPRRSLGKPHTTPLTGQMRGLVVLVQFRDTKFQSGHDRALYDNILNKEGYSNASLGFVGSVRDYFYDQSDGQLEYTFDVVGPVTLPNNSSYYGGSDITDKMKDFVLEALDKVKNGLDFSVYDNDGDGMVDEVFFLYAGRGSNEGFSNCIWPHMFYLESGWGGSFSQNGVRVDTYACANEMQGSGMINGIGTFCHEFSHCLGIPDMYNAHIEGYERNNLIGDYSIMDQGCYNGNGFIPCGYNAYERDFCGWRKMKTLTENEMFSNVASISDGGLGYRMLNQRYGYEYFIVEPRSKTKWDRRIPSAGFLIYHVDYKNTYDWVSNCINSPTYNKTKHYNLMIVPANNNESSYAQSGWTFPYYSADSFDDTTTPSSQLYYKNRDFSYNLHKGVYDMQQNTDGTFSFRFQLDETMGVEGVQMEPEADGVLYNAAGQRVGDTYTGVVIVNGKKIIR